jgi:hypothetical protein
VTKRETSLPKASPESGNTVEREEIERLENAAIERRFPAETPCKTGETSEAAATAPHLMSVFFTLTEKRPILLFYAHPMPVIPSPDITAAPSLWREMDNS